MADMREGAMGNMKAKGKQRGPWMNNLIKVRQEKQKKKKLDCGPVVNETLGRDETDD